MLELVAATSAGLGIFIAIIAMAAPEPSWSTWVPRNVTRWWAAERSLAMRTGWPWLSGRRLLVAEVVGGVSGALTAEMLTGLPALSVPCAIGAVAAIRGFVSSRARSQQLVRQDAVLEAVRMLRQLLESGAAGVQQGIEILGQRGPAPLRHEFRLIAAGNGSRRQAWNHARDRISEPLFDMLAAAVLVQGPGGGELAPLFADLDASVSAAQEVEREALALQVQARSASSIIVSLPIAFLIVLSMLKSPYLDAFHTPIGEAFLLVMLGIMGCSFLWMRRLLRLPGLERVRLSDA